MLGLRPFHGFALATMGIAAACAAIPITGDPAVEVYASAETKPVGTANEDAADDPAIWRNAADPLKSLIVGTDKKGGLYVYNLSGEELSFMPGAGLNNVDLVELGDGTVLVAASDRADLANAHILLARLDTDSAKLTRLDRILVGPGEGYGICLDYSKLADDLAIFSAPKNGVIYRTSVTLTDEPYTASTEILTTVPSQPEGCVVDPRTGTLYIGEEEDGIWAINMADGSKRMVASVDNAMMVADVEGLAIAPEGDNAGYLVASSQGDNAYAVFQLPDYTPIGRFRIAAGQFGASEETDGIELDHRSFGPDYPEGLFIAQDGVNGAEAQNFKLVSWGAIRQALEQPTP